MSRNYTAARAGLARLAGRGCSPSNGNGSSTATAPASLKAIVIAGARCLRLRLLNAGSTRPERAARCWHSLPAESGRSAEDPEPGALRLTTDGLIRLLDQLILLIEGGLYDLVFLLRGEVVSLFADTRELLLFCFSDGDRRA